MAHVPYLCNGIIALHLRIVGVTVIFDSRLLPRHLRMVRGCGAIATLNLGTVLRALLAYEAHQNQHEICREAP